MVCPFLLQHKGINVTLTDNYRPKPDPDTLVFGKTFTDHMLQVKWSVEHGWDTPRITPYGNLSLSPACSVLHYGTEVQCVYNGGGGWGGDTLTHELLPLSPMGFSPILYMKLLLFSHLFPLLLITHFSSGWLLTLCCLYCTSCIPFNAPLPCTVLLLQCTLCLSLPSHISALKG